MNVKFALQNIKELVLTFKKQNQEEKLLSYSSIIAILSRLDEIVRDKPVPNYNIYKHELLWSCEAICGLDDGNGHDESTHISWALAAVNKLESYHCFNVDNFRPDLNK